ncbi:MAG TPA: hypothetical protein VN326_14325 [Casimicrobiaceae bacterium]|jgi:ferredoxin-NADP reductase|nr:hypothetical protein [Casimicrobiaceae bacterium]
MTELKVIVKRVRQEALDVRAFELLAADAKPLPAFTPGSHVLNASLHSIPPNHR